jgi:hypothetical protein
MAGFAKVWLQSVAGCSKYGCAGKVQKCGCIVYVRLGAAKVWLQKLWLAAGLRKSGCKVLLAARSIAGLEKCKNIAALWLGYYMWLQK